MDKVTHRCSLKYSSGNLDTANYLTGWGELGLGPPGYHRLLKDMQGAFQYQSSGEINGEDYWGRLHLYPGKTMCLLKDSKAGYKWSRQFSGDKLKLTAMGSIPTILQEKNMLLPFLCFRLTNLCDDCLS